jgi:hypothetical protein
MCRAKHPFPDRLRLVANLPIRLSMCCRRHRPMNVSEVRARPYNSLQILMNMLHHRRVRRRQSLRLSPQLSMMQLWHLSFRVRVQLRSSS